MKFHIFHLTVAILLWHLPGIASGSDEEAAQTSVVPPTLFLDFSPDDPTVVEEELLNITLNVRDNGTADDFSNRPWMVYAGRLTVVSDVPYNLMVVNGSDAFEVTPCDFLEDGNHTVTLLGKSLGYANLQVYWERQDQAVVFNLTECSEEIRPTNWTAPEDDPDGVMSILKPGGSVDTEIQEEENPGAVEHPSLEQSDEETEQESEVEHDVSDEVEEQETEHEDVEEAEHDVWHEDDEEPETEQEDVPEGEHHVWHDDDDDDDEEENEENTDSGVLINQNAQRDELHEFPQFRHLFANETSDVQNNAEKEEADEASTTTTTEATETTTAKKRKNKEKNKNKNKKNKPKLLSNQTGVVEQIPSDSSKSVLLEEHVVEPEPVVDEQSSTAQRAEVPPEQRQDDAKPAEPHLERGSAIYDQGVTFLFKRSQDLTMEETEPVDSKILLSDGYKVRVIRYDGALDKAFVIVIGIMVFLNVLMMGCQIELPIVWSILKKPIGPAVGFFSQFAFMPLASYVLGLLLLGDANLRLGLFTLGCSPGGNGSNFWTLLLKGDLNLSMTMTFISTTCSIFMMPLWLYTLGQTIIEGTRIVIPFKNLIFSLFSFAVPVGIGVAIRRYKPGLANIAKKCIRPFTLVILVVLITLSVFNASYLFRLMTWQMLVSGICIAWGGYVFGAFMAWVFRQNRAQIIAISIETAIQNPGITFLVLRMTIPQPESDISSVAPMAQLCVTSVPLLITLVVLTIYRKCCRRGQVQERQQHEEQAKNDIDAADPLIINRNTLGPSTSKEASAFLPSATYAQDQERRITPPPPYSNVNMYAQVDEKELQNADENTFAKRLAHKQESYDVVPPRNSEHLYENFRNGPDPLHESKV